MGLGENQILSSIESKRAFCHVNGEKALNSISNKLGVKCRANAPFGLLDSLSWTQNPQENSRFLLLTLTGSLVACYFGIWHMRLVIWKSMHDILVFINLGLCSMWLCTCFTYAVTLELSFLFWCSASAMSPDKLHKWKDVKSKLNWSEEHSIK